MKIKFNKSTFSIFAIILVAYVSLMLLLWQDKGIGFWCFFISSIIVWLNMLFIHGYTYGGNQRNAAIMDQSLYIVPVVTYIIICIVTWKLKGFSDIFEKLYVAVIIVIFVVSFILQILMFRARKSNIDQEQNIASGRWNRDELAFQWKKITEIASVNGYIEVKTIADKLYNDIKYSDPVSNELLTEMDQDITIRTCEILSLLDEKDVDIDQVVNKIKDVKILFEERIDKCERLK